PARPARAHRPRLPARARRAHPGPAALVDGGTTVTPPRPARLPPSPAPGVDVSARMSRTAPAGPASVPPAGARRVMDEESRAWVDQLRRPGAERDAAVLALHGLLLAAARFEVHRRRARMPHVRGDDCGDL